MRQWNDHCELSIASDTQLEASQHNIPQQEPHRTSSHRPHQDSGILSVPTPHDSLPQSALPKARQNHCKPFVTEPTFLFLFLFLVFTLAFIGGIEGVLRKGVPIKVDTSLTKSNAKSDSTRNMVRGTGQRDSDLVNRMVEYSDSGVLKPSATVMNCVGIEMIISITETEQCDTISPSKLELWQTDSAC